MKMTLRQLARDLDDVFQFVRTCQNTSFRGCTGTRELAAIWYRVHGN